MVTGPNFVKVAPRRIEVSIDLVSIVSTFRSLSFTDAKELLRQLNEVSNSLRLVLLENKE